MFQLLPGEVAPLVWEPNPEGPRLQSILQALVDVILDQVLVVWCWGPIFTFRIVSVLVKGSSSQAICNLGFF